jgi:hypothetical protein
MPYRITRHPEQLLWVVVDGHLSLSHAEGYLRELWELLDSSADPHDLLVDGRLIAGAAPGARRRTEQIVHHPNLGHLAFVVGDLHLLLLAPLVKLVSGVGLFGDEHAALAYLRASRGLPSVGNLGLPNMPPPPADLPVLSAQADQQAPPTAAPTSPTPSAPATSFAPLVAPAPSPPGGQPAWSPAPTWSPAPAPPASPPVTPPPASPPPRFISARRFVGDQHPRPRQLPPPLTSRQKHTPLYPGPGEYGRAGSGDKDL